MSIPRDYIRVSKRRPCPICQRPDFCLIHKEGTHAGCSRTQIGCDRDAHGADIMVATTIPTWRHTLTDEQRMRPSSLPKAAPVVHINAHAIHSQCRAQVTADDFTAIAEELASSG